MKKFVPLCVILIVLISMLLIKIPKNDTDAPCADGHSFSPWAALSDAGCDPAYTRTCSGCGMVQRTQNIAATTLRAEKPILTANAGEVVLLSLYSLALDEHTTIRPEELRWSSDDLSVTDHCVLASEAGVYRLSATVGDVCQTFYLAVKNPDDPEYVLFDEDFENTSLEAYRPIEVSNGAQYYISDGKLILDAYNSQNSHLRVLLPEWLGDFGDYDIHTTFSVDRAQASNAWFAVMARLQNGNLPYWQALIRCNTDASDNVQIVSTSAVGEWNVTDSASLAQILTASGPHTHTFSLRANIGYVAINGFRLLQSEDITYSSGEVGLQVRGATVSVDRIKIVLPATNVEHLWGEWSELGSAACTENRTEIRLCLNCNARETRMSATGHSLVQHAAKMPTCTEVGWPAYEACTRCSYSTMIEVPATGHSYERSILSVAHRGYSAQAPENTLEAYRLARELGFLHAECDIAFTADGIPVLIHDNTIDRTSNGTGKVSEMTYAQLLQYDFGSWKGEAYAGAKIPTFEAFIQLCAEIGLHPYIELKSRDGACTQETVRQLVDIAAQYNMLEHCTWVSYSPVFLGYVKNADPAARLGYINDSDVTKNIIATAKTLYTASNQVFLALAHSCVTDAGILLAASNEVALEVYTVNTPSTILNLSGYISGVHSDSINAQELITAAGATSHTCIVCKTMQPE